MLAAGGSTAGRVRFDPVTRRRVRRAGARVRPLLLPLALVVAALVLASSRAPDPPVTATPSAPVVPEGMVLVAVQPSDPAVLPLAVPGRRVDVYAAAGQGMLDPLSGVGPGRADLVVRSALVVGPPAAAPPGSPASPGSVGSTGALGAAGVPGGPASLAVTLLVADDEAAALAARPGGALLLAVRGSPAGSDG